MNDTMPTPCQTALPRLPTRHAVGYTQVISFGVSVSINMSAFETVEKCPQLVYTIDSSFLRWLTVYD